MWVESAFMTLIIVWCDVEKY